MRALTGIVLTLALGQSGQASAGQGRAGLKGSPGEFFGADDYPAEAIRAREEGRVVAKLWIDTTGKVASCTVTASSGSLSLDQATCRIALDKVTFTPATDRKGRPVAASYTLPVRWVLPSDDTPETPVDSTIELTTAIDATGEILACNFTATPTLPKQIDPCAEFTVGRTSAIRWTREGRPVGGTLVRTFRQRVTLDP